MAGKPGQAVSGNTELFLQEALGCICGRAALGKRIADSVYAVPLADKRLSLRLDEKQME